MQHVIRKARTYDFVEAFALDLQREHVGDNQAHVFKSAWDDDFSEPEFLIDTLIEKDTLGTLFAPSGTFKSFMAIAMACCVATGTDFYGRKVEQGTAFYIYGEGGKGVNRRFKAWSQHNGKGKGDGEVFMSNDMPDLLDSKAAEKLQIAISTMAIAHGMPKIIVIDTVARSFGAGDENSTKDMNIFVSNVDAIRKAYPDTVFLLVHHTGHESKGRMRGNSVLHAAQDFVFSMEESGGTITLKSKKTKDSEAPSPMCFEVLDVELGTRRNGEPYGSAVLVQTDAPASGTKPLKGANQIALAAFMAEVDQWGGGDGMEDAVWRGAFVNLYNDPDKPKTPDAIGRAYTRAKKTLIGDGHIIDNNGLYQLSKERTDTDKTRHS